jgi:hypothetical protein
VIESGKVYGKGDLLKAPIPEGLPGATPVGGPSLFLDQANHFIGSLNQLINNVKDLTLTWQAAAGGPGGAGGPPSAPHTELKSAASPDTLYSALLGMVNQAAQQNATAADLAAQLRSNKPQVLDLLRRALG